LRLQDRVEAERVDSSRPPVDVALDVVIAGSRRAVFESITARIGQWWGPPAMDARATGVSLESGLGGRFMEHWGDTGGQIMATVTGLEPDRHLRLTGPFHFGLALADATFDLEDASGGTLVRFSFRAVGAIDPAIIDSIESGWTTLVTTRLKALVEAGAAEGAVRGESNLRAIGEPGVRPAGSGSRRRRT
jgi:uncharacterized protein YndB with AHSA1/START domain